MAIKFTIQGLLIYGAMGAYLTAFILMLCKQRKAGSILYVAGFAIATAGFFYRWVHVAHIPLQNLFEVFLCMGMLAWPFSIFCRRFLGIGGEKGDMLMALVLLFPAGFVFNAEPQKLPPALQIWLFAPHVAAYMFAYVVMAKGGLQAINQLFRKAEPEEGLVSFEKGTYRMVMLGFPLLTLGLILGAWWGKIAWGDYWNWDPKELWSLVTWLVFLGYLHFRHMYGTRYPRTNSLIAVGGVLAIIITLLWVNLARIFGGGLHSYAS